MKLIILAFATLLSLTPMAWADEDKSGQPQKGQIRVQDLPKPIPQLLQKIQQLSRQIEPEISKLGSKLGEELTMTVKSLCEELQCQEKPESK